jgi:dihydrofolate reductase
MRVGGADLAGQAIKAGLADEVRLFLVPVVVGGGKRALPDLPCLLCQPPTTERTALCAPSHFWIDHAW